MSTMSTMEAMNKLMEGEVAVSCTGNFYRLNGKGKLEQVHMHTSMKQFYSFKTSPTFTLQEMNGPWQLVPPPSVLPKTWK